MTVEAKLLALWNSKNFQNPRVVPEGDTALKLNWDMLCPKDLSGDKLK